MAEYGFILGAIAVVVFVSYVTMGQDVNAMISWKSVDNALLGAM
jgi:Flp pilus assembly pilin Flp